MKAYETLLRQTEAGLQRAADAENVYRLSFSSETPIARWGELEILDHAGNAADLARLTELGVVLFNHDIDRVVGRVLRAWVEDGRGMAEIAFDEDDDSRVIRAKVDAGTLRGVSIRCRIGAIETVAAGAVSADGRFQGPASIARKWEALEVSIVSVPADASVGVGRSIQDDLAIQTKETEENEHMGEDTNRAAPEAAVDTAASVNADDIAAAERKRAVEVLGICRAAGLDPDKYVGGGVSVEEVLRAANERLIAEKPPLGAAVERDEGDKFRAAASDALLLRAGIAVDKPAEGARDLRSFSLRELGKETLIRSGIDSARRLNDDDLLGELCRSFMTPTAAFPAILDAAIDKAYRKGYALAPATFDRWTTKGSLPDFKESKTGYIAGGAGEFLLVPENGELKHDIPGDHPRPGRKLQTYGRQFTLTRQAFINDDIGFITTVPQRYAAAAKRTINKQVYGVLTGNPVVYDGETLFGPEHNNDEVAGQPTLELLQNMITRLMLMTDDEGNPIAASPRYVLAPVGLASKLRQIIGTATIAVNSGGAITTQNNPLFGMGLEIIEDAYLNTLADEKGWYLIADPAANPVIQIDYLNGNEIPTIRRMEQPGQLGFVWDIWLDWGIAVLDYRGIVRNKG